MRSLVNAINFSLAASILEKIGTPLSTSTSSLRFIAIASSRPPGSSRRHQLGVEPTPCSQLGGRPLHQYPAGLHDHDLLERLCLGRPGGDPDRAASGRCRQDIVANTILGAII